MPKNNEKNSKKNPKSKTLAIVAVLVVVILIISSVFIYFEYFTTEKKVEEKEVVNIIDDRISPLENQALILEVLRIRHRGLYDKLMTLGNSWGKKTILLLHSRIRWSKIY